MEDSKIRVFEDSQGDLLIEWDEDHPFASIFENWSEDQWIEAIRLGKERAEAAVDG